MPLPSFVLPVASGIGQIGGALFGDRKRSSCRTVGPGDIDAFKSGKLVPHVLWERHDDIEQALGKNPWAFLGWGKENERPANWDAAVGSAAVKRLAELHLHVFVPLCEVMEGGKYTSDPNSGEGLALYNSARAQFRDVIRSGRITYNNPGDGFPMQGGGATEQGPGGFPIPLPGALPRITPTTPGAQPPLQAGGIVLALGAVALLFFLGRS